MLETTEMIHASHFSTVTVNYLTGSLSAEGGSYFTEIMCG